MRRGTLVLTVCVICTLGAIAGIELATSVIHRSAPAQSSASPVAAALKPVLSGLIAFNGLPAGHEDDVNGWVVNVPWAQLEPSGPGLVTGNPIDRAIVQARELDQAHPGHAFRIKVRVLAGIHSPAWVKKA